MIIILSFIILILLSWVILLFVDGWRVRSELRDMKHLLTLLDEHDL